MNSDLVPILSRSLANILGEAIPATTGDNELLTIAEACRLTKFSRHTIHRWCKSGKIKFVKLSKARSGAVRIFRSSLNAFLRSLSQKQEPGA